MRAMRGLLVVSLLSILLAAQAPPELVVSVGHAGAPRHAAFAGGYLVTGGWSSVSFIDLTTGLTVRQIPLGSLVETIEPSPAGDLVAIGTCNHAVHLYDLNTLTLTRRLTTRQECSSSLSFTRDGSLLVAENYACCRDGGGLQVWNARTGTVVRELPGVTNVRLVAFGADRWLAVVNDAGTGTIFEWPSGRVMRTFRGPEHPGANGSVLMASQDGRYLGWTELGEPAHLMEIASGDELNLPDKRHTFTSTAAFLEDGRFAYIEEDQLFLVHLPGGPVQTLQLASTASVDYDVILHDAEAWLAIRRDGRMAAGKKEEATLVWDVSAARLRDVKAPPLVAPESLQWTRTGLIAFSDLHSGVRAWDDRRGSPVDFGTAITSADSLAFRPDGAHLAVAASDSMYVINAARRRPVSSRTIPPSSEAGVAYSHDGSRLAFEGPSGFWLFDPTLRPLRRIATLEQYAGIDRVAFSRDNRWIAASVSGPNPSLRVWPAADAGPATTLDLERVTYGSRPLAFSHDSKWLASVRRGRMLTIWSTAVWTVDRTWLLPETIRDVAFAPGDSRLAVSSDDEAAIWDAADGRKLVAFSRPGSIDSGIAWSPDGRRVATVADDGVLRVWSAADGRLMASLYLFTDGRDWLLVTPDGRVDGSDKAVGDLVAWRSGNRVTRDTTLTRARRVRGLWPSLFRTVQ